jgi:hypothetical protein
MMTLIEAIKKNNQTEFLRLLELQTKSILEKGLLMKSMQKMVKMLYI